VKLKSKICFLIFLFASVGVIAQDFKTYTYFQQDTMNLELDLFLPEYSGEAKVPLVIYVHGGGFSGGNRGGGHKLGKYLAAQGIACASITYTLYMKGRNFSCGGVLSEKVKAIRIAADQLWHATDFLMDMSEEIDIDTTKIFIAGSSAGAETVLHAAYWNREQMQLFGPSLAPEFKYVGVISGAGAIMDLNLITPENMLPTMLFHGDADPTVPFGTAAHHYCSPDSPGWLMLFGSSSIAKHLAELGCSYQLTAFRNGTHRFAGVYFYQDQEHVADFIKKVLDGQEFAENYWVAEETESKAGN